MINSFGFYSCGRGNGLATYDLFRHDSETSGIFQQEKNHLLQILHCPLDRVVAGIPTVFHDFEVIIL